MMRSYLTAPCVMWLATVAPLCADQHTATTAQSSDAGKNNGIGANKIVEYVDHLKENLRKNNDDYSADKLQGIDTRRRLVNRRNANAFLRGPPNEPDATSSSSEIPSKRHIKRSSIKTTTHSVSRIKRPLMKLLSHRPKHGGRHQRTRKFSTTTTESTTTSTTTTPPTIINPSTMTTTTTTTTTTTQQPAADVWDRLLEKSKKIREIANNANNVPNSSARPQKLRMGQVGLTATTAQSFVVTQSRQRRKRKPQPAAGPDLIPLGLRTLLPRLSGVPYRATPHPDQLDMAPASGAYIQDLRISGKLCYRHVLWPEGPKYDSKGNIILMAFRSKYGTSKDFPATKVPKYVLPRCCNCCKKSVLGCQ